MTTTDQLNAKLAALGIDPKVRGQLAGGFVQERVTPIGKEPDRIAPKMVKGMSRSDYDKVRHAARRVGKSDL